MVRYLRKPKPLAVVGVLQTETHTRRPGLVRKGHLMASISRDANGRRRIQFQAADGTRKGIRLGKVSHRIAEEIKVKVEALNAAIIAGCPIDGETAQWVGRLGDGLHAKLAAVGLFPPRETESTVCPRLGEFVDSFIAARTDHKPGTRKTFTQTKNTLLAYFGADR